MSKERNKAFFYTIIFVILLLLHSDLKAQDPYVYGDTSLALSKSASFQGENIDEFTGKLNFAFPIIEIKGRGSVKIPINLRLDQNLLQLAFYDWENQNYPYIYFDPTWEGVFANNYRFLVGKLSRKVETIGSVPCPQNGMEFAVNSITRFTFTDASGNDYDLRDVNFQGKPLPPPSACPTIGRSRGKIFKSFKGENITFVSDSDILDQNLPNLNGGYGDIDNGYVVLGDGTKYRFDQGILTSITDVNGNQTKIYYDTKLRTSKIIDSIGREYLFRYGDSQNPINGEVIDEIEYKGVNGQPRIISVVRTTLQNALANGETLKTYSALFPTFGGSPHQGSIFNPYGLFSKIIYPNGQQYKVFYNSYGEIARVESPSNSATEYKYEAGVRNGNNDGVLGITSPNQTTQVAAIFRRLVEKKLYENISNGSNEWILKTTLSKPEGGANNIWSLPTENLGYVDVKNFTNNSTTPIEYHRKYFHGTASETILWDGIPDYQSNFARPSNLSFPHWKTGKLTKIEYLDPTTNNVTKRETYEWRQQAPVSWWTFGSDTEPSNNPRMVETITELLDISPKLVSKKTHIDPNNPNNIGFDQFNNSTDIWEFDYGQNNVGNFIRRTHINYKTEANYILYNGAHLVSLPTDVWISDDSNGNNKKSWIKYEYDVYEGNNHAPLLDRENVFGHDSINYSSSNFIRGNLTAVSVYSNVSELESVISNYSHYDTLGNIVETIDGKNFHTKIDYIDNFGISDGETRNNTPPLELNGLNALVIPTRITNAMQWKAFIQVDYYTGKKVDAEDINGIVETTYYDNSTDRPNKIITANNSSDLKQQKTITHDDVNKVTTTTSDLFNYNDNLSKTETYYDSLGRTKETRNYKLNGDYIATQLKYTATGQISKKSHSFRFSELSSNNSVKWTKFDYDFLGRLKETELSDGSKKITSYEGNIITLTDPSGKKRRLINNSLGQLLRVDEPNDSGFLGEVSNPIQSTSYSYDVLGNLTSVEQNGSSLLQCGGVANACNQTRTFVYDSMSRLKQTTNPESGTIYYQYDKNNNLERKIDASGLVTTNSYDSLDRVVSTSYLNESDERLTSTSYYRYDGLYYDINNNPQIATGSTKGKLTSIESSKSRTNFTEFDLLGGVKSSQQIVDGISYLMSYKYTLSGALSEEQYPSGRTVKNLYDNNSSLSTVQSRKNINYGYFTYANQLAYHPSGSVNSIRLGNGVWESAQYNFRLQLSKLAVGKTANTEDILKLEYEYGDLDFGGNIILNSNNGNIAKQTITVPGDENAVGFKAIQTYKYDQLNRLQKASETISINSQPQLQSWQQVFKYDRYGNRRFNESETTTLPQDCNIADCNPLIDPFNNKLISSNYDNAGNLIKDSNGIEFIYDGNNKQTLIKDINGNQIGEYYYDGTGKRVKKKSFLQNQSTEETVFIYDAFGKLVAEYSNIVDQVSPQVHFLTLDNINNVRLITDKNGKVYSRRDFMPFGEEIVKTNGSIYRTSNLNYTDDTIRQKFTSYERDKESTLDYAQSRYYNPKNGRFTSVDPLMASSKKLNPQTFNRYSYVINNPLNLTDPTGMCPPINDNPCKYGDLNDIGQFWNGDHYEDPVPILIQRVSATCNDGPCKINEPIGSGPGLTEKIIAGTIIGGILGSTAGGASAGGAGGTGAGIFIGSIGGIGKIGSGTSSIPGGTVDTPGSGATPANDSFSKAEQEAVDFLEQQCGCKVRPNPFEGMQGNGDALVDWGDGEVNTELKKLDPGSNPEGRLKNIIEESAGAQNGLGQGRDIFIDVRNTNLTENEAKNGVLRAVNKIGDKFDHIMVRGNGFDFEYCSCQGIP